MIYHDPRSVFIDWLIVLGAILATALILVPPARALNREVLAPCERWRGQLPDAPNRCYRELLTPAPNQTR
jgi:hypothetical protein